VSQLIYTIGHSTRSSDEFVALLARYGIGVADVRTVPRSRRHPQFGGEALAKYLAEHAITYRHFPSLGGLRTPRPDSVNTAWQHPGFRGYADHMQTDEFRSGVTELERFAAGCTTTVLCAEAVWWRCHRRLLADALTARGFEVRHIVSAAEPKPHELSEFARINEGGVTYPGLL
jgi:uncharacterized protein (DUF488 family)